MHISRSAFYYLIQDASAYMAQIERKRKTRAGCGFGTVSLNYVFTQLWFVESGEIYLGIEL